MKILFDTSVLVAGAYESHEKHQEARRWLERVVDGPDKGIVATHSIAETYAILTRLRLEPRIKPIEAREIIARYLANGLGVVELSSSEYLRIIERLSELNIQGGATYDALIAFTALKANVDTVVTFNQRDFARVCPELKDKIAPA